MAGTRAAARTVAMLASLLAAPPVHADQPASEPLGNVWNDPFFAIARHHPDCPTPAGPAYTREEAVREAHARTERGTSCHLEGRCRLPNAYLYDAGIAADAARQLPRVVDRQRASIWVTVQRRWVLLDGCVTSRRQGEALVRAAGRLADVERVIDRLVVRPGARR